MNNQATSSNLHPPRSYVRDGIRVEKNMPLAMRDGTVLRMDVYRPDDDQQYPVLLTRTPYSKELWKVGYEAMAEDMRDIYYGKIDLSDDDLIMDEDAHLVRRGFVRVRQDMRGRFTSDGDFVAGGHMLPQGFDDAYDSIEALAEQPWCNGKVGAIGSSYDASTSWGAAFSGAPSLKAIAPSVGSSSSYFEMALLGGPPYFSFLVHWTLGMALDIINRSDAPDDQKAAYRKLVDDARENPWAPLDHLPLADNPCFDFPGVKEIFQAAILNFNPDFSSPAMAAILDHQMQSFGFESKEDAIYFPHHKADVAVLNIGGWYDYSSWSQFNNLKRMQEKAPSDWARSGQHVLMGPWIHYGMTKGELPINCEPFYSARYRDYIADFFEKYLKDDDNIELPRVRYFTIGADQWEDSDSWPPEGVVTTSFYLSADGGLSQDLPTQDAGRTFDYDPMDPVPTCGGRHQPVQGVVVPGPHDQAPLDDRSDILRFQTAPLDQDQLMTGEIKLHLWASTSATDTDFVAQLIDIHPDGRAFNMADGAIRGRVSETIMEHRPLVPNEPKEFIINLSVLSHLFKKGHAIRLDVTSSNYPSWDRNMNTGNPVGVDKEGVVAHQTIFTGPRMPSHIDLPLVLEQEDND